MRVDYGMIPELQLAARRHRAEAIVAVLAAAFAWLWTRAKHANRARHGQTLVRGW